MKIKGHVDVKQNQEIVVSYFANPDYLGEYQDGFQKKELISGNAGEEGAVSKMFYLQGKRKMVITETITANNLPDSFEAHYHHIHMDNTMKCNFKILNENLTRYEYEIEYTRINWIMPKLVAILFPSLYRKQVEKWMKQFKTFVESK